MLRAVYMYSIDVPGREAWIGNDKMDFKFFSVDTESDFKTRVNSIIKEFKKPDTKLFKVSFYNEKTVPLEISFEDVVEIETELRNSNFDELSNDTDACLSLENWEMLNETKLLH